MMTTDDEPVNAARHEAARLAAMDYRVFPCRAGAKLPATTHGCNDATDDPATLAWPAGCNLGLATGGVAVIDVDTLDGSPNEWEHIAALEATGCPVQQTPRGGRHYIFRRPPGRNWRCSAGKIAPGIDVRTDGGYIVAAPSVVDGKPYRWIRPLVAVADLPEPPEWLKVLLDKAASGNLTDINRPTTTPGCNAQPACGPTIGEGKRNDTLTSLAGKLRSAGLDASAIEAALLLHNRQHCSPPLPEDEVRTIAQSIGRYPAGTESPSAGTGSPEKSGKSRVPVPVPVMEDWKPFPLDALPAVLRRFAVAAAACIGCDPSFVVLPLLTMLASTVGSKRRIRLKHGWTEAAILWCALVGESGEHKSPSIEIVVRHLKKRQERAFKQFAEDMKEYEKAKQIHEAEASRWKKKPQGEPPTAPDPPVCRRYFTSDVTPEKLAVILQQNTGSGFVLLDELNAWMQGFNRYSSSKGEAALWLSLHGGRGAVIDRKLGGTIYIRNACVSLVGGVQPGILRRTLPGEHEESGMAARFLFAHPPRRPRQWHDEEMDPRAEKVLADIVDRLSELEHGTDDEGEPVPIDLRLSREARRLFVEFVNAHGKQQLETSGSLAAAYSKLEGGAARLALILHLSRWAAGEDVSADEVDGESMHMGITLSRWFAHEATRIYGVMSDSDDESDTRELIEWIRTRGGRCTVQQLSHGPRRWRGSADSCEALLRELVRLGLGSWETVETGGAPHPRIRLGTGGTGTGSPEIQGIRGGYRARNHPSRASRPGPRPAGGGPMSLLGGLRRLGLTVSRDGAELVVEGPAAALTEAVAASIRYAKDDLLAELDAEQPQQPDPLGAFLADPVGTPQADVDRLVAGAFGLEPHLLSSFNIALCWRHGLDPQDVFETARLFDEAASTVVDIAR